MRRQVLCLTLVALLVGPVAGCTWPRLVLPHDPLSASEHVTLGEAYRAKGLLRAAEREFQKALERQPDYLPAWLSHGNLAFTVGDWETAAEAYGQVLAQQPDNLQALNNLAMVHLSRGERLDEAERLARRALAGAGAWRPYVLETLAQIAWKQGRREEALRWLDEAEQITPPEQTTLHERVTALRRAVTAFPASH